MDLAKVNELIAAGDVAAVEGEWMEAMDAGASADEFRGALAALVSAGRLAVGETLCWLLLSQADQGMAAEEALRLSRTVLPAMPANRELRDLAVALYRKVHGGHGQIEALLKASGLAGDQTFRRAMLTLDTCLAVTPGAYLAGRFDQRVFRVAGFNAASGMFELQTPSGQSVLMEPRLLADELEAVDAGDFRVLTGFAGPDMDKALSDDPAAVLIGICRAHNGQITATALKDLLVPRYLAEDRWSGWWNRARTAAKRSPSLSLEGRNPATLMYHPQGRTLEQELAGEAVRQAREPRGCLLLLQQYARELKARKLSPDASFVGPLLDRLAEQAESFRHRRAGDALEASLAIETAGRLGLGRPGKAFPSAADLLAESKRPAHAVATLSEPSMFPAALDLLCHRADAADQLEKLLRLMPADRLDEIAARLEAAGRPEAVTGAAAQAVAAPVQHLQLCLWLWQGPAKPVACQTGILDLLTRLIKATDDMSLDWDMNRDVRREAFQQVRGALMADDFRAFRAAVEQMDQAVAETMKRRIERSDGLAASCREGMLAILKEKFYSLFITAKAETWLDESTIWTSEAAFRRLEEELRQVVDVKMPANSRAIGEAAAHGDISENSDWKYAMEEQQRLQARVAQLQNDLVRCRILQPHDVPTDSVGIGSRVKLSRIPDGADVVLTFLGLWDADLANRVYSYQTQIAQSLMGKKPGDEATLTIDGEEATYRIEALSSAVTSLHGEKHG